MIELAQQLAVIMIGKNLRYANPLQENMVAGKQCINNCQEMFIPMFKTWLHRKKVTVETTTSGFFFLFSVKSSQHWSFSNGGRL